MRFLVVLFLLSASGCVGLTPSGPGSSRDAAYWDEADKADYLVAAADTVRQKNELLEAQMEGGIMPPAAELRRMQQSRQWLMQYKHSGLQLAEMERLHESMVADTEQERTRARFARLSLRQAKAELAAYLRQLDLSADVESQIVRELRATTSKFDLSLALEKALAPLDLAVGATDRTREVFDNLLLFKEQLRRY